MMLTYEDVKRSYGEHTETSEIGFEDPIFEYMNLNENYATHKSEVFLASAIATLENFNRVYPSLLTEALRAYLAINMKSGSERREESMDVDEDEEEEVPELLLVKVPDDRIGEVANIMIRAKRDK